MYQDMMDTIGFVNHVDPEVGAAMGDELKRQRRNLEMCIRDRAHAAQAGVWR